MSEVITVSTEVIYLYINLKCSLKLLKLKTGTCDLIDNWDSFSGWIYNSNIISYNH